MNLKEIINLREFTDAMRSNEYKDIFSAAAEIVDNSLEAQASAVYIIFSQDIDLKSGKKYVRDIAFLDNGKGMDIKTLHSSLAYGESTRKNRESIGRFGVGLAQASLFASPRVEVYSWQKGEHSRFTYLDTNDIKSGRQTHIIEPVLKEVPNIYKKYFTPSDGRRYDFNLCGTLVIWKNTDKIPFKRINTLLSKFEDSLGKVFRYYINNNTNIYLIVDDASIGERKIKAIDPLFIMENTKYNGNPSEPGDYKEEYNDTIFEKFISELTPDGEMRVKVPFLNTVGQKKESEIIIKASVVKDIYYQKAANHLGVSLPGSTPIGKIVKDYEGISVLRALREVDFGSFDLYKQDTKYDPVNRWWGIEIQFNPELDEIFKVSNNKQHIELKNYALDESESTSDYLYSLLHAPISKLVEDMKKRNESLKQNSQKLKLSKTSNSTRPITPSLSTGVINSIEGQKNINTYSKKTLDSYEDKRLAFEEYHKQMNNRMNDELDVEQIKHLFENEVNIFYDTFDEDIFFKQETIAGKCHCTINQNHPFYKLVINKLHEEKSLASIELFLAAIVRISDELDNFMMKEIMKLINNKVTDYLNNM